MDGVIVLKEIEARGIAKKKISASGDPFIEFELDPRDRPYDMRAQERIHYFHLQTLETQSKYFTGDEIRDILGDGKEVKKRLKIRFHDVE